MREFINRHRTLCAVLCLIASIGVFFLSFKLMENAEAQKKAEIEKNKLLLSTSEKETAEYLDRLHALALEKVLEEIPGIVCWGDGLTFGMGGKDIVYTGVLSSLIKDDLSSELRLSERINGDHKHLLNKKDYSVSIPVYNMGVPGEEVDTILGRSGAIPYILTASIRIPADTSRVEVFFRSQTGNKVSPLLYGNAGLETVSINGIEGKLTVEGHSSGYSYFFQRSEAGELAYASAGTPIITAGSKIDKNMIPVILIGASGGYETSYELMRKNQMLAEMYGDRYIIIGIPTGTRASRAQMEALMQETFGDKYINLREYMCTDAFTDSGLTPTQFDEPYISEGTVPVSFRYSADNGHFNDTGYTILGKIVYQRMDELGYFDEVREALAEIK